MSGRVYLGSVCVATLAALGLAAAAWACVPRYELKAQPDHAPPGQQITVNAKGFGDSTVEVRWGSSSGPLMGTASGPDFTLPVRVPDVEEGVYQVVAVSQTEEQSGSAQHIARAPFEVTGDGVRGSWKDGAWEQGRADGAEPESPTGSDQSASQPPERSPRERQAVGEKQNEQAELDQSEPEQGPVQRTRETEDKEGRDAPARDTVPDTTSSGQQRQTVGPPTPSESGAQPNPQGPRVQPGQHPGDHGGEGPTRGSPSPDGGTTSEAGIEPSGHDGLAEANQTDRSGSYDAGVAIRKKLGARLNAEEPPQGTPYGHETGRDALPRAAPGGPGGFGAILARVTALLGAGLALMFTVFTFLLLRRRRAYATARGLGTRRSSNETTSLGCLLLVLVLVALSLPAATSQAQEADSEISYETSHLQAPVAQDDGRFGESLVAAGDLDGDGVPDMYVAASRFDTDEVADAGRVYAVSGRDRTVLFHIDSPEPQEGANFGAFLSNPGDLTGDGIEDVVIGTDAQDVHAGEGDLCGEPEPNGCNENQGKAWAFDGADQQPLYALDNPEPQGSEENRARFGSRVGAAGDITGDGVPDLLVGASHNDVPAGCGDEEPLPEGCRVDQGQVFIFSGSSGELVRTLEYPDEEPDAICTGSCGWFGLAVQGPGDTDGDGTTDHLVNAGSFGDALQGRMYLFSGEDGSLLHTIDNPFPAEGTIFGFQDVAPNAPGDVTGDGLADLYGAVSEEGEFEGQGYVFDGNTGEFLYPLEMPDPEVGDQLFAMDSADHNEDDVPDLYVGAASSSSLPEDQNGGTFVFDGRNGALLETFELPAEDRTDPASDAIVGPFLGWSVLAPGDLNEDGGSDYVATAPLKNEGEVENAGRVYSFLSNVPEVARVGCPEGEVPAADFADRDEIPEAHRVNVDCAAWRDIVTGFEDGTYGPALDVRRDQMATFIAGMLQAAEVDLPEPRDGRFDDVDPGNVHDDAIHRLAAAEIVLGGPEGLDDNEYGPALEIRRDQMASFLLRAVEFATGDDLGSQTQAFDDVPAGNAHFANVNGAAEANYARGFGDNTYRPGLDVRRDQMASFVVRVFEDLFEDAAGES